MQQVQRDYAVERHVYHISNEYFLSMALSKWRSRFLQTCIKMPLLCNKNNYGIVACTLQQTVSDNLKYHVNNNIYKPKYMSNTSNKTENSLSIDRIEYKIILLCNSMKHGSVSYSTLKEIIDGYANSSNEMSDNTAVLLLKCCGEYLPDVQPVERIKLANRIMDLMNEKKCPLSLDFYNTLLTVYMVNRQSIDYRKFLKDMSVAADETTYVRLLNVAAVNGDYDTVVDIISDMKEKKYLLCEGVYNALIRVNGVLGNIAEAVKTFNGMSKVGIKPSIETFACLAYGYAQVGDIPNLIEVLKVQQQSINNIMQVIQILSLSGYGEHIPQIMDFVLKQEKKSESAIINTIIELVYVGNVEDASTIVLTCIEQNICDRTTLINCLLTNMVKTNLPIVTVLNTAVRFDNIESITDALVGIAKVAISLGKKELTLATFEEMKKRNVPVRPHYYWPLLSKAGKTREESEIFSILDHMVSLNIRIHHDTLTDYVIPYIDTSTPRIALKKFESYNIKMSVTLTSLIVHLLQSGRLNESILLCEPMHVNLDSHLIIPLLVKEYRRTNHMDHCFFLLQRCYDKDHSAVGEFFITLLRQSRDDAEVVDICKLVQMCKRHGIQIGQNVASGIKKYIYNMKIHENEKEYMHRLFDGITSEFTQFLVIESLHPKEMNFQQLEAHLIELKTKNMNTRGVLRKLLHKYCKENDVLAAERIKNEFSVNKFEWSPGMKAVLFDLYVRNNMLDKAEEVLLEFSSLNSSFKIDAFKIINYATKLVKNERFDTALHVIQQTENMVLNATVRNCWHLLNAIAQTRNVENVERMFHTLVKMKYCKISNILLGPLVNVHLLRNDITSAVQTFMTCVNSYNCVPHHQEVIETLVSSMTESSKRTLNDLQTVCDAVSKIHGECSALNSLIIALAKYQRKRELHNILKKYNIQMDTLLQKLSVSTHQQKYDILLEILVTSNGIKKMNTDSLCNIILSMCKNKGDCSGAVKLWNVMANSNIKPSDEFQTNFNQLLMSHKYPLPSEIITRQSNK